MCCTEGRDADRSRFPNKSAHCVHTPSEARVLQCFCVSIRLSIHILSLIMSALLLCFFNEPQGCSHKVRWIHNWEHCSALVNVPLKPGLSQNKAHYRDQVFSMQEDDMNKYINNWLQDHFISSYMVAMPATLGSDVSGATVSPIALHYDYI